MLVLQPRTSTIIFGDVDGKVGVLVEVGASVKAVAVSEGGINVAVSVTVMVGKAGVFVIVEITGVGEKIEGVIVGGGAGNVGTLYTQPSHAVVDRISRKISGTIFFMATSLIRFILTAFLKFHKCPCGFLQNMYNKKSSAVGCPPHPAAELFLRGNL